ncbi:MAG: c-type cytochrome [Thermoanaerobaculia bacterium]|jgi:mono/diheme cytochrome c family protein|nr:c-type cytochrome [Thermoanaerobaculia bacterium]
MTSVHGFSALLRPSLLALLAAVALGNSARAAEIAPSTAATGPSWLDKLGRNFDKSSLGRVGALGPNEQDPELAAPAPRDGSWLRNGFAVRGADLFRFTCRSCHGAAGRGMPPEILPLTPLVQATSAEWQKQQGEGAAGRAQLAEKLLQHQLTAGGRSMPGFDFLSSDESEALLGYLEHFAGVADPKHADNTLQLPVDRIGEVIVKGTCQTCHEAASSRGVRATSSQIPPLAGMTASDPVGLFVAGARHRGQHGLNGKGPELTYLRDQELKAAYFYLAAYPPR